MTAPQMVGSIINLQWLADHIGQPPDQLAQLINHNTARDNNWEPTTLGTGRSTNGPLRTH